MSAQVQAARPMPDISGVARKIQARVSDLHTHNAQALDELQSMRDQTWVDLQTIDVCIMQLRGADNGYTEPLSPRVSGSTRGI